MTKIEQSLYDWIPLKVKNSVSASFLFRQKNIGLASFI